MGNKPKFVITDYGFSSIAIEREIIHSAGGELSAFQCKTEQDVIRVAKDADVLLVQWAPITRAVIEELPLCKAIVRYGIGIDNVDLKAARSQGIAVCNIPDYCVDEVADHTFALALALTRQLPAMDRRIRQNIWQTVPPNKMFASRQMNFVTLGFGRIARAVLERARTCKFHLATCDPYLPTDVALPNDIRLVMMDEALAIADVISLHVPLTDATHHMMDARAFAKMKSTSLLINTARGGLIDSVALAEALDSGQLAGAGLDVFESEPLDDHHPLRHCANTLLTSHVAWYSELSGTRLQRLAAEEAVRVLNEQRSPNRVA